jgi:hypothetical protein
MIGNASWTRTCQICERLWWAPGTKLENEHLRYRARGAWLVATVYGEMFHILAAMLTYVIAIRFTTPLRHHHSFTLAGVGP